MKPFFRAFTALLLLSTFGSPISAFAADLPTDRPVNLQECIAYALEHHNDIQSAQSDLAGSRAAVRNARSGYYPKVDLGWDYQSSGYEGNQVGSGLRRTGTFSDRQTVLGISQTFWDGGRTRASVRQAAAAQRASGAGLEMTRQQRVLLVTQAYFDVLLARKLADIAGQTVSESQEQLKMIQARADAGDAAKVDVYPVEVLLADAKVAQLQADSNVRIAENGLRNAMGLDEGPGLKLVDVDAPSSEVPVLDECMKTAFRDRPELVQANAQVDSAKAGLALAKAQTLPVPTASINYDRGLAGSGYTSNWVFGVGLTMNLFDGGAARADVASSRSRVESLGYQADQTRKDISTEVEEAYLNLTSALARLEASKPSVASAQKNLEVARARYQQGLAIPLEITTAQVSYANAQVSNAQALYDSYTARAQLDKAMGKRGY